MGSTGAGLHRTTACSKNIKKMSYYPIKFNENYNFNLYPAEQRSMSAHSISDSFSIDTVNIMFVILIHRVMCGNNEVFYIQ